MPGMPGMQMYSREEMMAEMAKQESIKSEDEAQSESSKSTKQYHGEELSIWQTIVQLFQDFWNWIRKLLGMSGKASGDL
jgi:hypothetical protein